MLLTIKEIKKLIVIFSTKRFHLLQIGTNRARSGSIVVNMSTCNRRFFKVGSTGSK